MSFQTFQLLSQLSKEDVQGESELERLLLLRDHGLSLSATLVVPPRIEETFYQLNNLPEQLMALFSQLDPDFPDEDEVEIQVPEAKRLIKSNFLLDEVIDAFYEAIRDLPPRLQVRRPDAPGKAAVKGQPTLIAVKALWIEDWSFDAVMDRLERLGSVALEARPVLIHDAAMTAAPEPLLENLRSVLGQTAKAFVDAQDQLLKVCDRT